MARKQLFSMTGSKLSEGDREASTKLNMYTMGKVIRREDRDGDTYLHTSNQLTPVSTVTNYRNPAMPLRDCMDPSRIPAGLGHVELGHVLIPRFMLT